MPTHSGPRSATARCSRVPKLSIESPLSSSGGARPGHRRPGAGPTQPAATAAATPAAIRARSASPVTYGGIV